MKDLTGKRSGKLVAVAPLITREKSNGCIKWLCKCDCGATHIVNSNHFIFQKVRSCGCLRKGKKYESD
jgi:hypothetical protein